MKKIVFLFIALLVVGVLWTNVPGTQKTSFSNLKVKLDSLITNPSATKIKNSLPIEKLNEKLARAAQQLSQLQNDPSQVELELRNWAQALDESELFQLQELSVNRQADQDLRFLAVTLLSWSKNSSAGNLLTQIAGSSFDEILNPGRLGDFEKILRLRAAEGLGELSISIEDKKSLVRQILDKTPYTEVADRAHRVQWNLDGTAPTPEKQDQEALEKLLSQEE